MVDGFALTTPVVRNITDAPWAKAPGAFYSATIPFSKQHKTALKINLDFPQKGVDNNKEIL